MFKSTVSFLLPALAFLCLSANAADPAKGPGKEGKWMNQISQACSSDIQKYCSDVTQGEGRVMACLKAHDDKLSDNCSKQWQQAKSQWKTHMKEEHAACSGDVQKFCGNADNPRDIRSCLQQHQQNLSASCKNFQQQNQMTG